MGKIIDIFASAIFIKPRMTLTQWSESKRILSRESSSNYGRFKAFSYQREPMDTISNPKNRKIVLLWASQLGKSEMINNTLGYFIDQEPSTILFMLPNEIDAEDYSKRRLAPMFRDCDDLNKLINANDANNTILIKNFKGGNLALVGSNSVSKLASKPIKVLLVDEADRCEKTKEGDSVKLAEKRTITFSDRKIIISSTPTLKGSSRIESEFLNSDQRHFYVKCPHCDFSQTLKFEHIVWDKKEGGEHDYGSVRYKCAECGALLSEQEKNEMVKRGEWIAKNSTAQTIGFFLNALYSPFFTLVDIVRDFVESKDDQDKLQTFINTIKAESFEPPSVTFADDDFLERLEAWDSSNIPAKVEFITAGADIQDNRIEINFIGWADGFEAFNIEWVQIWGNTDQDEVWAKAFTQIHQKFTREDGKELSISIGLIDSGFRPERVYKFCSASKRLVATKGASETSTKADFLGKLKMINKSKFMSIGTYKGKNELFRLLSVKEEGAGYWHYSRKYTNQFFLQLTAEKVEKVKNARGYDQLRWKKIRDRNEALDISVLALAGAKILKAKKRKRIIRQEES
ncbi:terminase gpA endonuclease subunit [Campylobacter fetus]|uniref:phage terminase large subunit family protein n=1 Tax=Campylobacter fetus TaxID=196 RepID=UPI00138E0716|nr:terminase gpA endonuclease subunit [Campylobacter fetus]